VKSPVKHLPHTLKAAGVVTIGDDVLVLVGFCGALAKEKSFSFYRYNAECNG